MILTGFCSHLVVAPPGVKSANYDSRRVSRDTKMAEVNTGKAHNTRRDF